MIDRQLEKLSTEPEYSDGRAFSRLVAAWYADASTEVYISREELKFALFEMLLLGHATTSSACAMLALQLFKNPDAMEEVRQELGDVGLLDPTSHLTLGSLNKLEYVKCAVKEVLRILPPSGGGYRKALQTFEINVSFHVCISFSLESYRFIEVRDTIFLER